MRCIVNLQGTLSDHNLSLEAVKTGTLATLGRGLAGRIGPRAVADARASRVAAVCVTVGHVLGPAEPWAHTLADLDRWDAFLADRADTFVRCSHPAGVRIVQLTYNDTNPARCGSQVQPASTSCWAATFCACGQPWRACSAREAARDAGRPCGASVGAAVCV